LSRRSKFVESENRKLTLLLPEPQERMSKIYSDPFNCVHVKVEVTTRPIRTHIRGTVFNFSSFNIGTVSESTLSSASPHSLFFQTNAFLSVYYQQLVFTSVPAHYCQLFFYLWMPFIHLLLLQVSFLFATSFH